MTKWIKEHPGETAAIVVVAGLLYMLIRGGGATSSSGGTINPIQLAQLNTSASIQQGQIAAQQQIAQLQANAYNNQLQASLDANEQNNVATVVSSVLGGQQQLQGLGIEATLASTQAADELQAEQAAAALQSQQQTNQYNAIRAAMTEPLQEQTQELAFLTGQGNVGAFDSLQAQLSNNKTSIWQSILSGLFGLAGA